VQSGGTEITLKDASGEELLSYTPDKNYQYIMISSPLLEKDSKYTLYSGQNNLYTFTVTNTVNANTTLQTTGGPGGFGGGKSGPGNEGPGGKFGGSSDGSGESAPNNSDNSNSTDNGSGT